MGNADQQPSQRRVIGQKFGCFEHLLSDGRGKEQRSVLFQCLCEINSLQNVEGLVDGQSGTVRQG